MTTSKTLLRTFLGAAAVAVLATLSGCEIWHSTVGIETVSTSWKDVNYGGESLAVDDILPGIRYSENSVFSAVASVTSSMSCSTSVGDDSPVDSAPDLARPGGSWGYSGGRGGGHHR